MLWPGDKIAKAFLKLSYDFNVILAHISLMAW